MKTLSVEEQIAVFKRPSVFLFVAHLRQWFLGGAVLGVITAIIFWHPVPLMIASFLGLIGLAEKRAGHNIVAALAAYDHGTSRVGEVSITITCWDMDNHYHAIAHEQSCPDWQYEFIPQGWQPSSGTYPARIWRDETSGRPVLATVEGGILIPRYDPKQVS